MMKIVTLVREKTRSIRSVESRHLLREWRYTSEESIQDMKKKRRDKIRILEKLSKSLSSRHFWSKWWITDEDFTTVIRVYRKKMRSRIDTRVYNT